MQLTDLKEERRATLGYFESETLFTYLNHLRGRESLDPVEHDGQDTAAKLSAGFPNVIFSEEEEPANKNIPGLVAEVRPEVGGTLLEALGLSFLCGSDFETQTVRDEWGLRTLLSTEIGRVIFCPGGIGFIDDEDTIEFFDHDLDLEKLKEEFGDDAEGLEDRLHTYFTENVNDELDDPYFDSSGADQSLYFKSGSEEELQRLVQLFVLTEPGMEDQSGWLIRIYAETDEGDEAHLDEDNDDSYHSKRLETLVNLALRFNEPVGWEMSYNDGAYDRRSGYSMSAESIEYDVEEIFELPARVRMAAKRDLRQWLEGLASDAGQALLKPEEIAELVTPGGEGEDEAEGEDAPAQVSGGAGASESHPEDEEPLFPVIPINFAQTSAPAE